MHPVFSYILSTVEISMLFSGPHKQVSFSFPEADNKKIAVEDEEDARMMARLDELEREELAAERGDETDDDESDDDVSDEDEHTKVYLDSFADQISLDQVGNSEVVYRTFMFWLEILKKWLEVIRILIYSYSF